MQHTFGTVTTDTTPPCDGVSNYLFFACSATGINGELWGDLAGTSAVEVLQRLDPAVAEAVLRSSGDLIGGDATDRFFRILSMRPELSTYTSSRGKLCYPGHLEVRDGEACFVDAAGRSMPIHTRSMWRHQAGQVTGIGMGRTRDFSCGGEPGAPAYYGAEREGQESANIVEYRQPPGVAETSSRTSAARRRPAMR